MSNNNKSRIPPHLSIYIISLLLIVLTSCILSPIYMQVGNDIVFMYTVLPIILNYAILLFETMYLALIFAGVAYSAYAINKGTEKKIPNIIYPLSLVFIKHVLNLLVSSIPPKNSLIYRCVRSQTQYNTGTTRTQVKKQ